MRRCLVVIAVWALAACGHGGAGPRAPAFAKGARVTITDGGQIFDALNTTDCVKWPSAEVKSRAGQSGWRGFHPDTGLDGTVVASLAHCDHRTQVVLVAVGNYVVPVTSAGLEAAETATVTRPPPAEGPDERVAAELSTSGYHAGDVVEITDEGGVYDTINQTDCLAWPNDAMKQQAGSNAWGGYVPAPGETGTVLAVLMHCDGESQLLILDVGGHLVPIGTVAVTPYSSEP